MTTYFLHGGYVKERNELNDAFYRRVIELVPEGGTMLLVYFAARDEEYAELYAYQKAQIETLSDGKQFKYVSATRENFIAEVETADAILMRGGSTNKLLKALGEYGDLKTIFEGKVVTGSSAGAYAIAAFGYDKSEQSIRPGFGLVAVRAICHYMSDNEENHVGDEGVAVMNTAHQDLPLIVLKDFEWKEFTV